jgi:hypothetical protein
MLNPYASFLGDRDPIQVASETPSRLKHYLTSLGEEGLKRSYGPGKWSAKQVMCHLADCEVAFAFRLRQALADDHHTIQPFDQEKWALSYDCYGAQAAVETFTALRNWNLGLIRSLKPEIMSKPLTHPQRGTMEYRNLLETMGGHDLNHLGQLARIAGEK